MYGQVLQEYGESCFEMGEFEKSQKLYENLFERNNRERFEESSENAQLISNIAMSLWRQQRNLEALDKFE